MLKVLIVDDEIKVCKLIHNLIDWNSMGLEVAGIVNDGEKALEIISEIKPDIVITDIRMPGFDGLELIRRTQEIRKDIYFVIISGYSQFEYAQNAIKFGVEDYLLKPIKKKELTNTLTKIIEKYSSIQSDYREKTELKTLLRSSGEKAKRNFLAEVLFHTINSTDYIDIDKINKEYYSHFKNGFFTVAIIRPFLEPADKSGEMISLLLTKIDGMIKEKLEPKCIELVTIQWEDQIVCLINTEDASLTEVKKQFNKLRIDITNLKDIFQKVNVVIGIGEVTNHMVNLYANVEKAELAILSRFHQVGSYIIDYRDIKISEGKVEDIITPSLKDRLLSSFETLSLDKILAELKNLKKILEQKAYHGELLLSCYNELLDILLYGAKNYLNRDQFPDSDWLRKQFKHLYTLDEIFNQLEEWIEVEFHRYMEIKKNRDSKPILQAKQYIKENYNKNISLEDISSMVGFNPAYFSSMFKKETGENFIDYVIKERIHNAKNYLMQSDMTVEEIALAVGYSDTKYFTKLFKKKTKLNPTEFRKLYG